MSPIDDRRPAEVTDEFRGRLTRDLAPLGFEPRAKGATFVRREGKITFKIELSSSHRNVPGDVTCWVHLGMEDAEIRKVDADWRAGGQLGPPEVMLRPPANIANSEDAEALIRRIRDELAFFSFMSNPKEVCRETCRRYVHGLIEPSRVVPYLHVRLGPDAAKYYATSLLQARQELWPSFAGAPDAPRIPAISADHGTLLFRALKGCGIAFDSQPPSDIVRSKEQAAGNRRCFFGCQLRAWGEREAACSLRRVGDLELQELGKSHEAIGVPITQSREAARLTLRAAIGEDRDLRRALPSPVYFQYHALMEPFA